MKRKQKDHAVCYNSSSNSFGFAAGICHECIFDTSPDSSQWIYRSGKSGRKNNRVVRHSFFDFSWNDHTELFQWAAFCYRKIERFRDLFHDTGIFSQLLFTAVSVFSRCFEDELLNICFGGFLYGMAIVVALKGNASTAGTDFIALYVSNRLGKAIWQYVFAFNAAMLCVFGYLFGWEYAVSIMFQFISTKTIDSFYHRYKHVALQVTTENPEEVVKAYVSQYRHGISVLDGHGGYSGRNMSLLHTVVSSYEVRISSI